MYIGDIINLKYMIFGGKEVDHAFDRGRPCVYIGTIGEKMYFVPLTNISTLKHKASYTIKPDRNNCLKKESHPNFREVQHKNVSFYEVNGYLTEQEMIKFFKYTIAYLTEIKRETDTICLTLAKNFLDSHNVKYSDKDLIKQDKKKK